MNSRICEYVAHRAEPDFFSRPDDEELKAIHTEIQHGIETATEVMTFEMDQELMLRAERILSAIGWTLEEACILFLYWCIECPEELTAWNEAHADRGESSCSTSPETPTEISAE